MNSKITRHSYADYKEGCWLKVPYTDLVELGIENNITSPNSHEHYDKDNEKWVYLGWNDDGKTGDVPTYLNALKEKGITIKEIDHYSGDNLSRIRKYRPYRVGIDPIYLGIF